MAEGHYLEVSKSARYFLSGPPEDDYKLVCYVLHGYGQLAGYFIKAFERSGLKEVLFIAPEGLHRFYLEGSQGRVGASWMTKEDRLKDIEDYCAYLDLLRNHLEEKHQNLQNLRTGVLGFSQGVATACRWLSFSQHRFDFLINYAGIYPPDLPEEQALDKMQRIPVKHLLGREDEYISEERMSTALAAFKKRGFPDELRVFEGRHKVYPEVISELFGSLT